MIDLFWTTLSWEFYSLSAREVKHFWCQLLWLQEDEEEEPDLTTIQEHILNKPTRYITHNATVHKCNMYLIN